MGIQEQDLQLGVQPVCVRACVCVRVCAYAYFTPLLSFRIIYSESSQNEPTVDSNKVTDEVWRILCGSSDSSCMCSVCVYDMIYYLCMYVVYIYSKACALV